MADENVSVKFGAETKGAIAGIDEVKGKLGGLGSSVSSIAGGMKTALTEAFAAFASIEAIKKAIDSTISWNNETLSLSRTLGITQQQASVLAVAIGEVHATTDQYLGALGILSRNLHTNEAAFVQLGIATRNTDGGFRNSQDIMQDTFRTLMTFKEGTDRNEMALQLLGRRWEEVTNLQRLTPAVMEEAAAKAKEFGVEIGPERAAQIEAFRVSLHDMNEMFRGLALTATDMIMPAFVEIGTEMRESLPAATAALKVAVAVLVTAFLGLKEVVEIVVIGFKTWGQTLGIVAGIVGEVASKIASADFSGANAAWKRGMDELRTTMDEGGKEILAVSERNSAAISRVWEAATSPGKDKSAKSSSAAPTSSGGGRSATDTRDAANNEAMAKAQLQAAFQLAHQKLDIEREASAQMLDLEKTTLETQVSLGEKTALEQYGSFKENLDKRHAADLAYYNGLLELARAQARLETQIEEDKIRQHLVIESEGRKKIAELNAEEAKKERALNAEIAKQDRTYNNEVGVLKKKTVTETEKSYESMFKTLERGVTTSVQGLVKGQVTFKQAASQIGASLVDDLVEQQIKLVFKQQATEAARTGAAAVGAAERTSIEGVAATESVALTGGAAVKNILSSAWETAANVYKSVSAIPVVGWILAPALALGALGAVVGFARNVASAAGGYDIPAGTNPMTQLHEREMVLPAPLADKVRSMTGSNRGGGATFNITAMDAKDVHRVLSGSPGAVSAAATRMQRNFMKSYSTVGA